MLLKVIFGTNASTEGCRSENPLVKERENRNRPVNVKFLYIEESNSQIWNSGTLGTHASSVLILGKHARGVRTSMHASSALIFCATETKQRGFEF